MVWIGLLAFIAAGAMFFGASQAPTESGRVGIRIASGALALLAFAAILSSALTAVPAGHVGVPVVFGRVSDRSLSEGLHLVNPLAEVETLSVRTETYTMSASGSRQSSALDGVQVDDAITAASSDGLTLTVDATINFRLVGSDAPWVYQNLGHDYVDKIIRPAARTAIRESATRFTSQEAYATRREEFEADMLDTLQSRISELLRKYTDFSGQGFTIQQVLLRNVALPATVQDAIESKLAAEQVALGMQFVLSKEEQEAERKRIEAKGIADFQRTVSEGISEELLQWKGIEATMEIARSNNAKVVIVGGKDGLPLILNTSD